MDVNSFTKPSKPNIELLDKTLAKIEEIEAKREAGEHQGAVWAQSDWAEFEGEALDVNVCGTSMCFAGWAVHLAGDRITRRKREYSAFSPGRGSWPREYVATRAQRLLGLTGDEASALFYPHNSLQGLKVEIERIKQRDTVAPEAEYFHGW